MSNVKKTISAADSMAHECAQIAGRLELTGAVNLPNLVALCQCCKEQLLAATEAYWKAKGTDEDGMPKEES